MMKKIGISIVFLALLSVFFLGFAGMSQTGLNLLIHAAERFSGGKLQIDGATGRLADRFMVNGLRYHDRTVTLQIYSLELFWRPTALLTGHLHIYTGELNGLHIISPEKEKPEEKTSSALLPGKISIPMDLSLEYFQLLDFSLGSSTETQASIERLELKAAGSGEKLRIDLLRVENEILDLELKGKVEPNENWPIELEGKWSYRPPGYPDLSGNGQITGSLADGEAQIELISPYSAVLAGSFSLGDGFSWQAELQAKDIDPSLFWQAVSGKLDIEASFQGQYLEEVVQVDVDIETVEGTVQGKPLHLSGDAAYDGTALKIIGIDGQSDDLMVKVRGEITDFFDLEYELHLADLQMLLADSRGEIRGSGQLSGKPDNLLLKSDISGENLGWQGTFVDSLHGTVTAELNQDWRADLSIVAENIGRDTVILDQVQVAFTGTLPEHKIDLSLLAEGRAVTANARGGWLEERWQGGIFELLVSYPGKGKLELDRHTPVILGADVLQIDNLCLSDTEASLCFTGTLRQNRWQSRLELFGIDPGIVFHGWPGALNANIAGRGELAGQESTFVIDVVELNGILKEKEIRGGGRIVGSRGSMIFDDIAFHHGDAKIKVNGNLGDNVELIFSLDIPSLHALFPQVEATLSASGEISGNRSTPALDLNFEAVRIRTDWFSLDEMRGDIVADLRNEGGIALKLKGKQLVTGNAQIDGLSVEAQGSVDRHHFTLMATTESAQLNIKGSGGYTEQWQGALTNIDLTTENSGNWQLQEKTPLLLGREGGELKKLCLQSGDAALCLQGRSDSSQNWSIAGEAESIPLSLLQRLGVVDVTLEGLFRGSIEAEGEGRAMTTLGAQASIPQAEIAQQSRDELRYRFHDTTAILHFEKEVLNVEVSGKLMEEGVLQAKVQLAPFQGDFQDISLVPLSGHLDVRLDDVSFISILSDGRFESRGALAGDITISGTLANPKPEGRVELENGGLAIADLGIELSELDLVFFSSDDGIAYSLTGQSGPGKVESSGSIFLGDDDGLRISSNIVGENIELFNTAEYVIRVSPDIKFNYDQNNSRLSGRMSIPHARIVLQNNPNLIQPSKDVVIISGGHFVEKRDNRFFLDMRVILGEDVRIEAYGLKSDLQGSVALVDEPARNLSATGELFVTDGSFTFYSVSLDITRGRLLFSGGDPENPGVDVRAQRTVDGKTVGVDITGTVQDMHFELFSEQSLEESDILSYILVGRPLRGAGDDSSLLASAALALGMRSANTITNRLGNYLPIDEIYLDKGEGENDFSLVIGKNVTENLFIGYDQSLLNGSGEVQARYRLGRNFSFETRNSVNSTSGDIIYTIER